MIKNKQKKDEPEIPTVLFIAIIGLFIKNNFKETEILRFQI